MNELLKRELGLIIQKEVEFTKEMFLTITRVKANDSLQSAKILITTFPPQKEEEALYVLNKNIFRLQAILNRRLKMRPIPKINFAIDKMEERAQTLEEKMATMDLGDLSAGEAEVSPADSPNRRSERPVKPVKRQNKKDDQYS